MTTLLISVYRESNCDATAAKSQKGTFYFMPLSRPTWPSRAISDVAYDAVNASAVNRLRDLKRMSPADPIGPAL